MTNTTNKTPILSNRIYDHTRFVVEILLPAMGTLYYGLALIWNFPYAEQVVGTLAAVALFLGTLIKVSNKTYQESNVRFDGALNVDTSHDTKDIYSLDMDLPLDELAEKGEITLKVQPPLT